VRAVHRRIEDLAAHEVTKPTPPLRFQLPDLPPLPGVTLLRADEVTVEGRLPRRCRSPSDPVTGC
jgi:macrolide transport system ATP-binding/permease protein